MGGQTVWPQLIFLTVSTNGWKNCWATIENPDSWLFYPLANCPPHGSSSMDEPPYELSTVMFIHQNGTITIFRMNIFGRSGHTVWCTNCSATFDWPKRLYNLVDRLFGHSFSSQKAPQFGGQTVCPPFTAQKVSQNRWSNCMATSFGAMSLPKLVARLFDLFLMTFELGPSGGQTVCH